jgi:hypothetical protein
MPYVYSFCLFGIALLCQNFATAAIKFDEEVQTVKVGFDQKDAAFAFTFVNNGESPIVIKKVLPSCGCTTADSDRKVYLPGDKGTISVKIEIGTAQGELDKSVVVETSDVNNPTTTLSAHVDIPRLVSFSPDPYVRWDQHGDANQKTVKVKVEAPFPIKITGIKSWHEKINATLKEITPGKEYEVTVWPTDTKDVINNAIELLNDAKPEKKIWLLVHVKPKGEL